MGQVGERYFFVSRSSQKGHDRLRTLLGKFWIWHAGLTIADKVDTSSTHGAQRRKEQKLRIVNYLAKKRVAQERMVEVMPPDRGDEENIDSRRAQALKRFNEMDAFRPEKKSNAYVLPKGTLLHRMRWSSLKNIARDDGTRFEEGRVFYGNDIFRRSSAHQARAKKTRGKNWFGAAVSAVFEQAHEDSMDRIVKTIVQNTMRGIFSAGALWMEDFAFGFERPIHQSITDKMNTGAGFVRVASVKNHSQYEYFLENFEVLAFDQQVDERDLPNTYVVNMIQDVEERLSGDLTRTLKLDKSVYSSVSLYSRIDKRAISFRAARNDENAIKQPRKVGKKQKKYRGDASSNSAYMNYLDLWSKAYKSTPARMQNSIRLKNHNILFSADSYDYFRQISSKSQNIPMSVKLEFSAPTVRKEHSLTELLRKGNFMSLLMQKACEASMDPDRINPQSAALWSSTVKQEWLSPEQAKAVETSGVKRQGALISEARYGETTADTQDEAGRYSGRTTTRGAMIKEAVYEQMTLDRSWGSIDYYPQKYSIDDKNRVHMTSGESVVKTSTKGFDILRFLDNIVSGQRVIDRRVSYRSTVIHTGKELYQSSATKPAHLDYEAKLNALVLSGQARKLVEERTRTWAQVIAGRPTAHEILFFEVEKVRMSPNNTTEVVQRFYIPNFVGRDSIELIDSQVKYNTVYQYKIHAWTAVYGNKYRYLNWDHFGDYSLEPDTVGTRFRDHIRETGRVDVSKLTRGDRRDGFWYRVENRPSLRLMRLPYHNCESLRVRDFPPVSPHVDIVPYRGVSDRLILNFTPGVDDHYDKPIALSPGDLPKIRKYYESQFNKQNAGDALATLQETGVAETPVRYKSDDMPRNYEVYRISRPPRSWSDFDGGLVRTLDVDNGETAAVETINPNEDYYYTFRSVDIHGNVSNPSGVLRVKIIDDQGIFPIIEPYDFESKSRSNENFKRSFRRFIQITPVFEQLVYKDERQPEKKTSIANRRKIALGTAQDPIYGKTLKIRLTSKKSGKKIDLNVSFSHEHHKPPR